MGSEGGVQVVDVGLMVLLMVELHDLLGDDGFQSLVIVSASGL